VIALIFHRRASFMNDQIMYQDRLIEISADFILFKNYYYPSLRQGKGTYDISETAHMLRKSFRKVDSA
jgi:hypothetical protein